MLVAFALLSARLLVMIHLYAVDILFLDHWDFWGALFYDKSLLDQLLWQHGPHRQGIGLPLTVLVANLSGWNVRAEAFVIGVIVIVACALALWLKRRVAGDFTYADVFLPLLFLSLGQYDTFFNAPNPAHSALPLLLMMGLGLAWTIEDRRLRYPLALVLDLLLVYTGFGIFAGVIVPPMFVVEAIRDYRGDESRSALLPAVCALIAAGILGSFFVDYRFLPAVEEFAFPIDEWWLYPRIVAIALGRCLALPLRMLEPVGHLVFVGCTVLLIVSGLRLLAPGRGTTLHWIVVLMIGFGLTFTANMAIGRASIGLYAGTASRYMTLIATVYFGLYLYLTTLSLRRRRAGEWILVIAALWSSAYLQPSHLTGIRWFHELKTTWRDTYLDTRSIAAADAATIDAVGMTLYPHPEATHLQWKLDYMEARGLGFFADSKVSDSRKVP